MHRSHPAVAGVKLLTVVAPDKREGSSPTGLVGRCLAQQLLAAGEPVRVLAEPGECHGWPDGVEVVAGSIGRPPASAGVFAGVDAVFLAGAHPATIEASLEKARDTGVRRIVLLSSHGP